MKKPLLIAVCSILITAIVAGYLLWNKPHHKAEDLTSQVIPVDSLYEKYVNNETAANKLYLNKTLELTGTIAEQLKNQDGNTVVIFQTSDPLGGVQCTFREKDIIVQNGQKISVKGFCNGYTSVVLLNECILL